MTYEVFISYSRKDSEVAGKIYDALTAEGISCFIDLEGISGGADFPTVLSEAIMGAKVFLLVASENSYASEFTQKEITFAVSNKGSRFIFPLIIDGSSLPKNLEFLLSNINWRTLSHHYRIEKELVEDVRNKLANPHAGETLKQQEKNTLRRVLVIVAVVMGLVLSGVIALVVQDQRVKEAQRQAEQQAIQTSRACDRLFREASGQITRADTLRFTKKAAEYETLAEEIASLQKADSLLNRVDSLRALYQEQPVYAYLFQNYSTSTLRREIRHRQDSMFFKWNNTAMEMYGDYEMFSDDINRQIAEKYVDFALMVRPQDGSLLRIKESLKK